MKEELSANRSQILRTKAGLQHVSFLKFFDALTLRNDSQVGLLATLREIEATSIASTTLLQIRRRINSVHKLTWQGCIHAELGWQVCILG